MDDLIKRLSIFETRFFPRYKEEYRRLVSEGQHPRMLFIGCSDSRIVPYHLTGSGPGDLFIVRNVGNLVPPWNEANEGHGTAAAVEFAVLKLEVRDIVVCGHSHCGAIRALYGDANPELPNLNRWLNFARDALLPGVASEVTLRNTEQRSVVLQLERLMAYPMVQRAVSEGRLFLHGWHYVIEEGRVLVLNIERGEFEPTDVAMTDRQPTDNTIPFQLQ